MMHYCNLLTFLTSPKPVQQPPQTTQAPPSAISNGLTPSSYSTYDTPPSAASNAGPRVKQESGIDNPYGGLPNGYPQGGIQPQGGATRAAQLLQTNYGPAANASVNAMQRGGGLALPGGHQQKPQLHLPAQSPPSNQQQYSPQQQQQQQQAMRQQQQYQQQQNQPRVKVENESPHLAQGAFQQQTAQGYGQMDGASDGALDEWKSMLAQRRALHAKHSGDVDGLMRQQILEQSAELESGLMQPLDQLPSNKRLKRTVDSQTQSQTPSRSSVPQLDGTNDAEDEDEKPEIKDESDAINSDLDDDDEGNAGLDEDEDETVDTILCTYDKVQRVKNKWKCTLKEGIMSANGKEWVSDRREAWFEAPLDLFPCCMVFTDCQ